MKGNNIEQVQNLSTDRFSYKSIITFVSVILLYLLWLQFGIGEVRRDHFYLIALVTSVYFLHDIGRKLALSFAFLIIYWIMFDSVRAFPNYEYMPIHIGDLYQAELDWFGLNTKAGLITANEYFGQHNNLFLDIYCAIIYICWIPVPIVFSLYLFVTNQRKTIVHFWFAFLLVSTIGLIIQYLYPAAAPWYVELHGIEGGFQKVPGNPGRLINFDHYFGVDVFSNMYSMNANVYAAVPSKHCAFPIISLFFAWKYRHKGWSILFIILMLSTFFSAVYTNHHYIIDVISGIFTALFALGLYLLLLKTGLKGFLDRYGERITS